MMEKAEPPKPDWLRVRVPDAKRVREVREAVRQSSVKTVCDASRCPNLGECWGHGTATFLLLGEVCTRGCRFCAVTSGDPGGRVDQDEPQRVAKAVGRLGLGHAVITSVARDDLEDGGASAFVETVRAIRAVCPSTKVELLVPDFQGEEGPLRAVALSGADVLAHNLEVVRRLQPSVRDPRASYDKSLRALERLKHHAPRAPTKTSLMLGLGESRGEVVEAMRDARRAGAELLTLGQYLRPKGGALRVERYVPPEEFAQLRSIALELGFREVMSGPLVRSSYHAHEMILEDQIC
ncbi:MAG: lipoyl synthase [Methanomassiliicoccales archaeon]|jgi:lipoic acid synthetase|nr:lipoyl synthase [Methanomassiliicoccales archaeon]